MESLAHPTTVPGMTMECQVPPAAVVYDSLGNRVLCCDVLCCVALSSKVISDISQRHKTDTATQHKSQDIRDISCLGVYVYVVIVTCVHLCM